MKIFFEDKEHEVDLIFHYNEYSNVIHLFYPKSLKFYYEDNGGRYWKASTNKFIITKNNKPIWYDDHFNKWYSPTYKLDDVYIWDFIREKIK